MPKAGVIAIFIAILSGLAIGAQSSLNNAAGKMAGSAITGLLVGWLPIFFSLSSLSGKGT